MRVVALVQERNLMTDSAHIIFKTVDESALETLVDLRWRFVRELKRLEDPEPPLEFRRATTEYFARHLRAGSYIGILGLIDEKIVCCAGLLLYDLPPLNSSAGRKIGHVLNFYTVPESRRAGAGASLLRFTIDTAVARGIDRLFLNATKMGEPLYRKAGFAEQEEAALTLEVAPRAVT
ncbi:MAG: GNAT family N-acetyltransferase [Spirochaetes bacterium]|nr:MAG: GNAT family N-acetyltransferase [Spirochaetota bacterium]